MLGTSPITVRAGATAGAGELDGWRAPLESADPREHVVTIDDAYVPSCPLLRADGDGGWRFGPYVGVLYLRHAALILDAGVDRTVLDGWVMAALGLPTDDALSVDADVAPWAALVWARSMDDASRHGPPAFRMEVHHTGPALRGHLDVRRTVRMKARGMSGVGSVYRERQLDNPVTRIIVAADRVLSRRTGHGRWRTDRVRTILPQLHTAVGRRSPVPSDREWRQMRFSPITRPFKATAELSSRIVRQDPVATTAPPGSAQGLLLDLDDVATGAVLGWTRRRRPELGVERTGRSIAVHDGDRLVAGVAVRAVGEAGGFAPQVTLTTAGGMDRTRALPHTAEEAAAAFGELLDSAMR